MAAWTLPASPDARIYREVTNDIARDPDKRRAAIKFRQICEADFFFFCWRATAFRDFRIEAKDKHPSTGQLWITQPFIFDRCREIQQDIDSGAQDVWYNWSRYTYKTTLITDKAIAWELLKDPNLTFCILTWKLDEAGEQMFKGTKEEFERNDVLRYHWQDRLWQEGETPDLWAGEKFNIKRRAGIREPSVSIHGLDAMPTSMHFDRVIIDDAVTQKTVETGDAMEKCLRMLRRTVALGKAGSTIFRHVGTVWDDNDPNMQQLREGIYSRRSHIPLVEPANCNVRDFDVFVKGIQSGDYKVNLYAPEHAIYWRKKMGAYEFSCNCQGTPCAKGDQFFEMHWVRYYRRRPEQEREGKLVHVVIDPAGGKEGGDFTSVRVQGLGADKLRYHLDLWRERWGPVEVIDLLLGPDEEVDPRAWHGPTVIRGGEKVAVGLLEKWQPEGLWLEEYGASGWEAVIKDAMESRGVRHRKFRTLPAIRRSKTQRIALLQPVYERGEMYYPEHGFGHGSKSDTRDTMRQYFQDEYSKWTRERNAIPHDDCLDSDAWFVQPEVEKMIRFPRRVDETSKLKSLFTWEHRPINQQERRPSFWGR